MKEVFEFLHYHIGYVGIVVLVIWTIGVISIPFGIIEAFMTKAKVSDDEN